MKLGRIVSVMFMLLLFSLLSALAQEQPPSLENHQFYGTVYWDKSAVAPVSVIAKIGGQSFSSVIQKSTCGKETCSGTYGSNAANILRVQAATGASIEFYLDTVKLPITSLYEAGEVTVLDLNVATFPIEKPGCIADWKCGSWSSCTAGKQTRSCIDQNKCNPDKLTQKETQSCGTAVKETSEIVDCSYQWDCSSWSVCTNSLQTRACARSDDCDAQFAAGAVLAVIEYPAPVESQSCVVGLAGSLPLKTAGVSTPPTKITEPSTPKVEPSGISIWLYVGIVVIVLGLIGLWLALRRKSAVPPEY
ncbi:hypothetical protein HYT55_01735 [Candidatus Woesearchaeota archaeon]|nr:hypothetical protein [Candidatus Woesearchaeota archaeon]